jgi:hypothetical protein
MAAVIPAGNGLRLARHAAFHIAIALLALSLFAAADSWYMLSGLGLAEGLSVITGLLAGAALPTLVHEWFHYFGARFAGAQYTIPDKLGLFVYDWKFDSNSTRQFYIMSLGGTLGSLLAIYFLFSALPPASAGRASLLAASVASLGFAGAIEWPVLWRTRSSGNPLAELSRIDLGVLRRSAAIGGIVGLLSYNLIY